MANQNAMGAMLNAYPDSVGGTLGDIVSVLQRPEPVSYTHLRAHETC